MIGYLLDTKVISEIVRSDTHPGVATFPAEHEDLWLSSIVIHELEYGVRRLPHGQRRSHLQASLLRLTTEYDDRILPLDRTGAEWAAHFRAQARHAGQTLDLGDALITGTAKSHDLAITTRNTTDFEHLGVAAVNPWESP